VSDETPASAHGAHNRERWDALAATYQERHGGQLAESGGAAQAVGADHAGDRLVLDYWDLHELPPEPDQPVDFQLPYGEWIRLFHQSGLVVEDLVEIRPPADATSSYLEAPEREWARRWPLEHVWCARRAGTESA
jgi:hypothetical protein